MRSLEAVLRFGVIGFWAAWLGACGGGRGTGRVCGLLGDPGAGTAGSNVCSNIQGSCTHSDYCLEWGPSCVLADDEDNCVQTNNVWSTQPCDRSRALSGCYSPPNQVAGCVNMWFYVTQPYSCSAYSVTGVPVQP